MALSSRNNLLNVDSTKIAELVANELSDLKKQIKKDKKKSNQLINIFKKYLLKKFNIKIQYLECRNLENLSTNIQKKPFRIFLAYYLNNVRLIDNF